MKRSGENASIAWSSVRKTREIRGSCEPWIGRKRRLLETGDDCCNQINEGLPCKATVDVLTVDVKSPPPTRQLHCYRSGSEAWTYKNGPARRIQRESGAARAGTCVQNYRGLFTFLIARLKTRRAPTHTGRGPVDGRQWHHRVAGRC